MKYALELSQVPQSIRALTNGKNFEADICDSVQPMNMNWSGGTRYTYTAVNLETGEHQPIIDRRPWPQSEAPAPPIPMKPGWAVVLTRKGTVKLCTIYMHADNAPAQLAAPEDYDRDMLIVLTATKSLKSSYGGIKNYRLHEAKRDTDIDEARWAAALERCQQAGLLRKNKSITPAGRNACRDYSDLRYFK